MKDSSAKGNFTSTQPDSCKLPEAEVVAEIEDCVGDDCCGGAPLHWPPLLSERRSI